MKKLTLEQAQEKLIEFVTKNHQSMEFNGKKHLLASAWTYAGSLFKYVAVPAKPEKTIEDEVLTVFYKRKGGAVVPYCVTSIPEQIELADKQQHDHIRKIKAITYNCSTDIMSGKTVVSKGFGLCSNRELFLCGFDEYSLLSMSQTRSIAKGFRNIIGHIAVSSGFSDTPAEEIQKSEEGDSGLESVIEQVKSAKSKKEVDEILDKNPALAEKLELIQAVRSLSFS